MSSRRWQSQEANEDMIFIGKRSVRAWTVVSASLAAILTALALTSTASALPIFRAAAAVNDIPRDFVESNISAGAERRIDGPSAHAFGAAVASAVGLRASAFGSIDNGNLGGAATAVARFDDFVIHGPSGPVTTSFNLVLTGSMSALSQAPSTPDSQTQANAFVVVQTAVNDLIVTADPFARDRVFFRGLNGVLTTERRGMLSNWPADNGEFGLLTFTTPTFTVDANEPFSLELQLLVSAGAFGFLQSEGVTSSAHADFGSTLAFPSVGPVFNLPDGFTVDSVGARIQNNQFVGAPSAVPEPSGIALLVAGVAGLGVWSRWSRRGGRHGSRSTHGPLTAAVISDR